MKIHMVSNSLHVNSGFGKVCCNLALGLKKLGYDVTMTGLQTATKTDWYYGIECLPIDSGGHVDETTQLILNLQNIQPDILIYVGQMDSDMNHFTKIFGKTICYSPVEGMKIPDDMTNDMKYVVSHGGLIVAQCKYGQSEMKKVGIDARTIYHGYDPNIFYKTDSSKPYCYYRTSVGQINTDPIKLHEMGCYDCRHTIFGKDKCPNFKEEVVSILRWNNSGESGKWTQNNIGIGKLRDVASLKGRFVYLFVGQNFGYRKRIERLLTAYAILINDNKQLKDRTHLHLHTLPISIRGVNLIRIIGELGINDNVTFSYGAFRSSGWSEQSLNVLYNLADVNVSASSSEGFCLPVLEGMATGLPMVAPACSSFIELIGDGEKGEKGARGYLAIIESQQMIQDGSFRSLVDQEHLAVLMKKIYNEKDSRERFSRNAIDWAKQYTWDKVLIQWDSLLKTI